MSQDYNEAVQSPESSFADAELRLGQAATNALGLPLPRSGNFADVYEMVCPSGKWAVKCFTREVKGLRERYAEISKFLAQSQLPFMVDFQFLDQGIRIKGQWYPLLKMRWVEGLLLNQFVRDHLDKPAILENLFKVWMRLSRWLRDAEMAHCDLQHGNIILVPGSRSGALALKLIDYDGMFVPALAGRPSGEFGHPSYQHPQRAAKGYYGPELDRLPLLAVACGLRALIHSGKSLWDRFDTGDNILFREIDLKNPGESVLFKELWNLPDAATHDLTGYLTMALSGELTQVPWVDRIPMQDRIQPLNQSQEEWVSSRLGPGAKIRRATMRVEAPKPTPVATEPTSAASAKPAIAPNPGSAANPFADLDAETPAPAGPPRRQQPQRVQSRALIFSGIGVFAVLVAVTLIIVFTRGGGEPVQVAKGQAKPPVVANDDNKKNDKHQVVIDADSTSSGKDKRPVSDENKKKEVINPAQKVPTILIKGEGNSNVAKLGEEIKAELTSEDPLGPSNKPSKTYVFTLERGNSYVADLRSDNFVAFLQLIHGNKSVSTDQIWIKGTSAHLWICPTRTDSYQVVVTSHDGKGAGAFSLLVKESADKVPLNILQLQLGLVTMECIISEKSAGYLQKEAGNDGLTLGNGQGAMQDFNWTLDRAPNGYFLLNHAESRDLKKFQFLNGETKSGKLSIISTFLPHYKGHTWKIHEAGDGLVQLECGQSGDNLWLQGLPSDGTVRLTSDKTQPGTTWRIMPAAINLAKIDKEMKKNDGKIKEVRPINKSQASDNIVKLGPYESAAPNAWIRETPKYPQWQYQFKVPDPQSEGQEGLLYILRPEKAKVENALNMWRRTLVPTDKSADMMPIIKTDKRGNLSLTTIDIQGKRVRGLNSEKDQGIYRKLGVFFECPGGPFLIELTGPAQTVVAHKKAFDEWLRNFK